VLLSKKSLEHIRNETEAFLANDNLVSATVRFNSQGQQYVQISKIMDDAARASLGFHRTTTPTLIESLNLKKEYSIIELDNRRDIEKRDEGHQRELERMRALKEFEHQRATHIARAEMEADAEKVAINTGTHSFIGVEILLHPVQGPN
jgi:hypothetical protein